MVIGKLPAAPGVPAMVAVPSPLSTRVTPEGRAPVSVMAAVGFPVEVTENVPGEPWVKLELDPLVMAGAAGAGATVRVNAWVASEPTPLEAVMVIGKLPAAPGVPASVAVPSPLLTNVTPAGSEPVSLSVGVGTPVADTVNVPAEPLVKVVADADVIAGADFTVRVNDCVAFVPTPLAAVMVNGNDPVAVGVPASVAVPFPLSTKDTPAGKEPVSDSVGVGGPAAVTVKVPAEPAVKEALFPLVITGAALTVRVNA